MTDLYSSTYRLVLLEKNEKSPWSGSAHKYADGIAQALLRGESMLDFGCGPKMFLERYMMKMRPDVTVVSYDPGHPDLIVSEPPTDSFDLVVALDTLEHIEPAYLKANLSYLQERTSKAAFFVIGTTRAKEKLPDGRDNHLIVQGPGWWLEQLRESFPGFTIKVMWETMRDFAVWLEAPHATKSRSDKGEGKWK